MTLGQVKNENNLDCKIYKHLYDEAAKIFGVSQLLVSDLITGKWEKFSLEMLMT